MVKFVRYSANPFKPKAGIGDCVIRAITVALNMPYEMVCQKLRKKCIPGKGLATDGVYTDEVKKFFRQGIWFDYTEYDHMHSKGTDAAWNDPEFDMSLIGLFDEDPANPDVQYDITVEEWIEENAGTGIWILDLEHEDNAESGHFTVADTDKQRVIDTWDCRRWRVEGAIKPLKQYKKAAIDKIISESKTTTLAISAMLSLFAMSGVLAADKLEAGTKKLAATQQVKVMSPEFDKVFKDAVILNKKFGGYSAEQACSILAKTIKGEAGADVERKANGHYMVADTIINRCGGNIDRIVGVCLEKYQYSYWNKADRAKLTPEAYDARILPSEVKDNVLEQRAWNECLQLAADILTGKYKAKNKKINSYHVYKGERKCNPDWSGKMTNVVYAGTQKFGYLASNSWDQRGSNPDRPKTVAKKAPVTKTKYTVKSGDVVSKIAASKKIKLSDIQKLNPSVNLNKIKPGQVLFFPA